VIGQNEVIFFLKRILNYSKFQTKITFVGNTLFATAERARLLSRRCSVNVSAVLTRNRFAADGGGGLVAGTEVDASRPARVFAPQNRLRRIDLNLIKK
jgi:hypothetical protein